MYPLYAVANPHYGMDGDHEPTILVPRPWTATQCSEACTGLGDPETDPVFWCSNFRELKSSFHLNGTEVETAFKTALKHRWGRVRGNFNSRRGNNGPILHPDDPLLTTRMDEILERVMTAYQKPPDYSKIRQCRQKPEESVHDFKIRLEGIFKTNSGLPEDANDNGPYHSQLRQCLMDGFQPHISGFIQKHCVTHRTLNTNQLMDWASHAEENHRRKKGMDSTTAMAALTAAIRGMATSTETHESSEVYAMQRGGERRGQRRGQGQQKGGPSLKCYNCGKPGHLTRECRSPKKCFNCQKEGHMTRECPLPDSRKGGSNREPPRDPPFNPQYDQ
ncbi:uncharacterized protein LOC133503681 isoform X2 [Syngnathoides biaculeatus]|uniref:uncharacterized protein LOC133503681 isoform X2 n=1 Tax=Syngnathoides biaculeatus TaxID=300417 RepID=UPI002ADE7C4B|nr:uncharacterized protein LOC133503681 isoform X2 [Syngnathoides biaculeatus]